MLCTKFFSLLKSEYRWTRMGGCAWNLVCKGPLLLPPLVGWKSDSTTPTNTLGLGPLPPTPTLTHTHTHTHTCTHTHTYTHTHTDTRMHTHINTYTHVHTAMESLPCIQLSLIKHCMPLVSCSPTSAMVYDDTRPAQ